MQARTSEREPVGRNLGTPRISAEDANHAGFEPRLEVRNSPWSGVNRRALGKNSCRARLKPSAFYQSAAQTHRVLSQERNRHPGRAEVFALPVVPARFSAVLRW